MQKVDRDDAHHRGCEVDATLIPSTFMPVGAFLGGHASAGNHAGNMMFEVHSRPSPAELGARPVGRCRAVRNNSQQPAEGIFLCRPRGRQFNVWEPGMNDIFTTPPLSSKSYWRDRLFFADHPDRKFRVRAPILKELRRAKRGGALSTLAPGQSYVVIVSHLNEAITTILAKARLPVDGCYPDTDDEISRAFAQGAGDKL